MSSIPRRSARKVDLLDWEAIASRLKQVRGRASQVAFGEALGVPQNVVSRYERARVRPPLEYLVAVARLADVSLGWLVEGERPKHRRRARGED